MMPMSNAIDAIIVEIFIIIFFEIYMRHLPVCSPISTPKKSNRKTSNPPLKAINNNMM